RDGAVAGPPSQRRDHLHGHARSALRAACGPHGAAVRRAGGGGAGVGCRGSSVGGAARRRDIPKTRHLTPGTCLMHALAQDLRYSLRTLARSPGLSFAAVLTLGLGIGANTAMFGVVDRLFFRPPAHVIDPDRVVRIYVTTTTPPFGANTMPIGAYPRYADFRDHARSFVSVAAYGSRGLSLGVGPAAEGVAVRMVTASFFSLLGARPDLGRFFSTDEDSLGHAAHVAVLSREYWTRRYGADRGVLGQRLRLGRSVYTIIGVAPRGFSGIDLEQPDLWLPLSAAAP